MTTRSVAAAAVLLLTAAALPAAEPAARPAELDWLPRPAPVCVHVRFAEVSKTPLGDSMRKAFHDAGPDVWYQTEQAVGVSLDNFESITLLVPSFFPGAPVLRVTTIKPYRRDTVLAALKTQ